MCWLAVASGTTVAIARKFDACHDKTSLQKNRPFATLQKPKMTEDDDRKWKWYGNRKRKVSSTRVVKKLLEWYSSTRSSTTLTHATTRSSIVREYRPEGRNHKSASDRHKDAEAEHSSQSVDGDGEVHSADC